LNDFAILITQKRKLGAKTGSKGRIYLRRIDAHHHQLTVVNRQLFLEFDIMAQLHLAFASPVSAIERQDQWKFAGILRKLNRLTVMIDHLEIGELLANILIHNLLSTSMVPQCAINKSRLWVALCHFGKESLFLQLLQQTQIYELFGFGSLCLRIFHS